MGGEKFGKEMTFEERDLVRWCGIIDRNPSEFSQVKYLRGMGVPERLWGKLAEKFKFINEAMENEFNNKTKNNLVEVFLPSDNLLISDFSDNLASVFERKNILFYRSDSKDIVEIGNIKLPNGELIHDGFMVLRPNRFITLIEKYIIPTVECQSKGGIYGIKRSMSQSTSSIVLESPHFIDKLPVINRIFTVQIPIVHDGKLTFPKIGYDERFGSWLPITAPKINNPNMNIEDAKKIILFIFKEFCFQEHKDFINAIAGLLTPFLRGLYPTFNTRSPIFAYLANRERAGKDFCAGITGQLYEGQALEEPPISDGEYSSNGKNDELKKKLLSAMMLGRKRLHFANNKGRMNSAVFEQVTTAERFSDRKLGKNEILTFDNELDFSFSGNLDIRLTPDLANRCRIIHLFLDVEDANSRSFDTPNLHKWIRDNREMILSALFSFVKHWYNEGMQDGIIPFSSFPQWAKICGGIMESVGYDNPCVQERKEMLGLSLDSETDDMKNLFELLYEKISDKWISKHEIVEFIKNDETLFNYMDWASKSDQTKFGIKLNKFVGRILSNIRLAVQDENMRSSRWKYKFTMESIEIDKKIVFGDDFSEKDGNLGNLGNDLTVTETVENQYTSNREKDANVTKVTNNYDFTDEELKEARLTRDEVSLKNENEDLNKIDTKE